MVVHHLLIFKQHMTLYRERKYELGFPKKLVNLSRILNTEIDAKVNTGTLLPSKFKVNKGLRQGDAIAPLLFHIVLETAIRRPEVNAQEPLLTNVVKLWHMLMLWFLWEEEYRILKYLHH